MPADCRYGNLKFEGVQTVRNLVLWVYLVPTSLQESMRSTARMNS